MATKAYSVISLGAQDPTHSLPAGKGGRTALIHAAILEAVMEHRLPPGTRLPEDQIGALFHASRTIVRAALQALAHDHIVTIAANRGAMVASPDIHEARDLFNARRVVEAAIVRQAAASLTEVGHRTLLQCLDEEAQALLRGDRARAIRLSGQFHLAIARIADQRVLSGFLSELVSRSSLVIAHYGRGQASTCGHDEHRAMVAALAAGDGDRAAALMGEHLDHIESDLDLSPRLRNRIDLGGILRAGRDAL